MSGPPLLPPGITSMFVPARGGATHGPLAYMPAFYASGSVRIVDARRRIAEAVPVNVLVPLQGGATPLALERAALTEVTPDDLESTPRGAATYGELPRAASTPRTYETWRKAVATWLYDTQAITLQEHAPSGTYSLPGESEVAFRARLSEALRVERDANVDAIRDRYAAKLKVQDDRIRKAAQQLGKQEQEVTSSTGTALLTAATGVFGALFGRKTFSAANAGRIGTAARGAGKVLKEKQDVTRARENLAAEEQKLVQLQATIEEAIGAVAADAAAPLQPLVLRPRKTDITVTTALLVWLPEQRS